jgi:hypothetical protein
MKILNPKAFISLLLMMPVLAFAHSEQGIAGGFVSGFTHPIFGWDHVAAMVAVGLWGAFLGKPALWLKDDKRFKQLDELLNQTTLYSKFLTEQMDSMAEARRSPPRMPPAAPPAAPAPRPPPLR